jgi:hypothetical protein
VIREGIEAATAEDLRAAVAAAATRVRALREQQAAQLAQHRWTEAHAIAQPLAIAEAWLAQLERYLATLPETAAASGPTVAEAKAAMDERLDEYNAAVTAALDSEHPDAVTRAFDAWRALYTAAATYYDARGVSKAGLSSLGGGPRQDLRTLADDPRFRGFFGPARR